MSQNVANSSTGGYLNRPVTVPIPNNLTFTQFIQTVLVGVSGLAGELVRPDWQLNPPKRPDQNVNWLAFGVSESTPSFNSLTDLVQNGDDAPFYQSQHQESFVIKLSVYGPDSLDLYRLIRDGFQIPQNREGLLKAKMGLVDVSKAIRNPELIDERWFDRWECFVNMRYEAIRTYPVLTLVGADGTIWAPISTDDNFHVPWLVTE